MRVGIFYSSISNPSKFPNKTMLMDNFAAGVKLHGDEVVEFRQPGVIKDKVDVGFVLGYTIEQNYRKQIIDSLLEQKARPVFVDSNVLHYARGEHEWHRYSLDSVYPDSGTYFFTDKLEPKWETYSTWHNVSLKPWRVTGSHILLLCQRPHGWNMLGTDQDSWISTMIGRVRQYSKRPIRIRMHPGDGTKERQISKLIQRYGNRVEISRAANILEDLTDCWLAVGYNSTPNSVAAIEGVPVYLDDPVHSWAQDIAIRNINSIETPQMPDRTQWLEKIANIHWSNEEVKSGKLWAAIKQHISAAQ